MILTSWPYSLRVKAVNNMHNLIEIMLGLMILSSELRRTFGYDDLSNGKASSQILTLPPPTNNEPWYVASNAVDRNLSTCTGNIGIGGDFPYTSVWWRVDLGGIYSIHSIRILFKDYGPQYVTRQRGRFAGFSIYLSNSTNREDWVLCYKDGPDLPPLDFNTTCIKYGRYVIYYNERLPGVTYPEKLSYSALCEVIVLGCAKKSVYGVNCDEACSVNCQEHKCHIVNGNCLCKPGYTGHMCERVCPKGWYGSGCKNECVGHCKHNSPCHPEFGNCTGGCASGWMGTMCSKECEDGNFGPGCIHKCSANCLNGSHCNKTTGGCDLGCSPGYKEPFCNTSCTSGKFGIQCKETCRGHCLNHTKCNHVDGNCNNGCDNGYTGDRCDRPCQDGLFGVNCSQKCSLHCRTSQRCNKRDGSCPCSPGWSGPHCSKECDPGFYGQNCLGICRDYCVNGTCNSTDGSCLVKCSNGIMCKKGGEKCAATALSNAKEYHIIIGILGVYTVVSFVMFAVFFVRTRIFSTCRKTKDKNILIQMDKNDEGKSNATIQKDRTSYEELNVIENKNMYQELHVEGNAYQNLDLIID